jgi:hypothetical protein
MDGSSHRSPPLTSAQAFSPEPTRADDGDDDRAAGAADRAAVEDMEEHR